MEILFYSNGVTQTLKEVYINERCSLNTQRDFTCLRIFKNNKFISITHREPTCVLKNIFGKAELQREAQAQRNSLHPSISYPDVHNGSN